jgi:hypothetical protein
MILELKNKNEAGIDKFELDYWLELGQIAEEKGSIDEANNWYSIGLKKASEVQNLEMIKIYNKFKMALFL